MASQEAVGKERQSKKMEEARQISRLREEQERAIKQTKEKIDILDKFKQDYVALKDRLVTLPDKITHDVMVPFGKLAFMPGQLVHTNEVLVLLGDNWFAEMSAKQAGQTVDRRIQVLDDQLTELQQQGGLLEPRLQFTSELQDMAEARGDLVEIKEEYDEEKETLWKEEHRKNVQAYNRQRREEEQVARETYDKLRETRAKLNKSQENRTSSGKLREPRADEQKPGEPPSTNDTALWDRLAELEKLEEEAGEMETTSSESGSSGSSEEEVTESRDSRRIRWKDEGPKPRDRNKTIYFTHTKPDTTDNPPLVKPLQSTTDTEVKVIRSPADIYIHCTDSQPRSILKHSTSTSQSSTQTNTSASQAKSRTQMGTGTMEAFSGSVVEKPVKVESSDRGLNPEPAVPDATTQPEQRPVSRFKAQRMARK